jgi:peptidoglycan/xylan/chitin deacetylase (PgdA/CDA1 family)
MKILALKIYADTMLGYRDGVPRLLDICDELGIEASFFFGMGSEDGGSPLSKILGEGQDIVASAPGILRDAHRRGQDCGVYGWNPMEWRKRLDRIKDTTLEADIKRAVEYFALSTGARPNGFAAPGFRVSYMSLRIQDEMRFKYCSDTFGFYPYLPQLSWKVFSTPQVPATLPPVEINLRRKNESSARELLAELSNSLPRGLSVLPMNAAMMNERELFSSIYGFLSRLREHGVKFMSLRNVAASVDPGTLSECEVVCARAFGMPNEVAIQSAG